MNFIKLPKIILKSYQIVIPILMGLLINPFRSKHNTIKIAGFYLILFFV